MRRLSQPLRILFLMCLVSSFLSGPDSVAQDPDRDIDDLAKRLCKEIAKSGLASIVIADFVSKDGTNSRQGYYIADELSRRLEHHKKHFDVVARERFSTAFSNAHLSTKDLTSADSLRLIRDSLQADGVRTGTVEITPAMYSVNVALRSVKDGAVVASANQSVKRPGYVDTGLFLDTGSANERIMKAGVAGVSIPTCEACPLPTYTGKARAAKIQGNVLLLVVINQEGRAVRIAVTRSPDDDLTSNAIEAVQKWKFKPATDKEGCPGRSYF